MHQDYLTTTRAAEYLGLSRQFLEGARHKGGGPAYIKLSRAVRYRRADLDAWMLGHRRQHTAQATGGSDAAR
jgi:excisionase family DNA binding protein